MGVWRIVAGILLCALLSACSADERLEGRRSSVLAYGQKPIPDKELRKTVRLPKPETTAEWTQAGGLSHHAMQNIALPEKIMQAWKTDVGKGASSGKWLIAEPVAHSGIVYTIDAVGKVRASAAISGKMIWERNITADKAAKRLSIVGAGLALDNNMLFAALGTGEIVASDAYNGHEIWRVDLKSPVRSAPAVYGGRLYVLTADNKLTAVAEDDGRVLWRHYAFMAPVSLMGRAAPALDKGIGIAVFASGEVVAFRPENGSILWTETFGATRLNNASSSINDIRARPVIDNDRVYIISAAGLLSALDLKSGAVLWEREIGGINQPWIAGDILYVVSSSAELIALDAADGKILWVNQLSEWDDPDSKKERLYWTGPVLAGDRLILSNSAGKVIVASPVTGTVVGWDDLGGGSAVMPAIVVDNTLFLFNQDAELAAYR